MEEFIDLMIVDNFGKEIKSLTEKNNVEFHEELLSGLEKLSRGDYVSTSSIQRWFVLGYAKAANLCDDLIEHGFVGERQGSRRQSLIDKSKLDEMKKFIIDWLTSKKKLFFYPDKYGVYNPQELLLELKKFCKNKKENRDYKCILKIIDYVTLGEHLQDYREHIVDILNKAIQDLTITEIKYYFRAISRDERFCGGLFDAEIENGRLKAMFERFVELENQDKLDDGTLKDTMLII